MQNNFWSCVGGLCAWHIVPHRKHSGAFITQKWRLREASWPTELTKFVEKKKTHTFFLRADFLYIIEKNAFIHSLSIYCVSAAVQCSEGGTVRTSVGFLLPWRMRLAALVLAPRLTASFQDGWDCLKSLRCILWHPRTFECYFYSLHSSGNRFGNLSHRTESGVATIFQKSTKIWKNDSQELFYSRLLGLS